MGIMLSENQTKIIDRMVSLHISQYLYDSRRGIDTWDITMQCIRLFYSDFNNGLKWLQERKDEKVHQT